MKLVRSLSTLVLLACVTITLGCTANESTSGGGGGAAAGSGVAGGAEAPHTHSADEGAAHADEHKTDETKAVEPKADEPKAE